MNETRIDRGDFHLAAYVEGDAGKPWIVLSNSVASTHRMWDPQMSVLTRKYRVLRYDTRGHGASDAPPGPYAMAELARDIVAIMDGVGVETADFMGLSLGGMMALDLALDHAPRFGKLVCCDAGPKAMPDNAARWGRRIEVVRKDGMVPLLDEIVDRWMTEPYRQAHPEAVAAAKAMILQTDPGGYAACAHALMNFDYDTRLGEIARPMLFVCGQQDLPLPASMERMSRTVANGQLALVGPGAHLPNLESPDKFNAAIAGWLGIA